MVAARNPRAPECGRKHVYVDGIIRHGVPSLASLIRHRSGAGKSLGSAKGSLKPTILPRADLQKLLGVFLGMYFPSIFRIEILQTELASVFDPIRLDKLARPTHARPPSLQVIRGKMQSTSASTM